MAGKIQAFAAVLLLSFQVSTWAQTATPPSSVVVQVQGIAPQLLAFAGSNANFQSLVNGLALGQAVTLVSITTDGFTQTVSFTPAGPMSVEQIASTLDAARQSLIARGIALPNAVQLGTALVGGTLPTALGGVQVNAMVPTAAAIQTASLRASSVAGASQAATAPTSPLFVAPLSIDIRPTQPGMLGVSASSPTTGTSNAPATGNTSNTPFLSNTSNTPTLPATIGVAPSGTGSTTRNGPPSPAAQLQGRR